MHEQRFNQLREYLLREGIAPRHVRRYVGELRDHFDDLLREETEKGLLPEAAEEAARKRLGSDDRLAEVVLNRPELRSMTARYPWAVFGFGPLLILAVVVAASTLIEGGLFAAHIGLSQLVESQLIVPDWLKFSIAVWNGLLTYAAPLAIAAALFVVGIKQRMASGWMILGTAIICVAGGFHEIAMNWSDVPGESRISVGIGASPPYPQFYRAAINLSLAGTGYWWWLRRTTHFRAQ